MTWNWLSWIVVALVLLVGGFFVFKTVSAKGSEHVILPPPPPPVEDAAVAEPPPDAAMVDTTLSPTCEEVRTLGNIQQFPADKVEREAFCLAWIKNFRPAEPAESPTWCGPEHVVKALRELDRCARLSGVCDLYQVDSHVDVELTDIFTVADKFPIHVVYYDVGITDVVQPDGLIKFVRDQLASDRERSFMIFGSASPTAADPRFDAALARKRTESAFQVVNDELSRQSLFGVETRKANVGSELPQDFCSKFNKLPALQRDCLAHGIHARRQAAFIVSYPAPCLVVEGG